jgi:hypothetical protein
MADGTHNKKSGHVDPKRVKPKLHAHFVNGIFENILLDRRIVHLAPGCSEPSWKKIRPEV